MNEKKAKPELEDFGHKYTQHGRVEGTIHGEIHGFVGGMLINNYFRTLQKIIEKLDVEGIENAVELGAGEGYSTQKIRDLLPKSISLSASEYVQKNVDIANEMIPSIKFIQEDVYEMKRDDNSVDLTFLLEVLEHLDEPREALREIKRVTSQYLILGVPNEPIWRILNMARGYRLKHFGNTIGHLNHWSRWGIIKLVEEEFGEVVSVRNPLPWTILLAKKS